MKKYKIAVIAGDGIGPEVIAEGVKVLNCGDEFIKEIDENQGMKLLPIPGFFDEADEV